jgi:RimJ/RimL family protein N-acetyltransferase
VADVALRPIDEADLDALFDQMRDPESVRMAAFTAENPDDRAAFDDTEITYWIDRSVWGQGIASQALALLLDLVPVRPLYARAASDNVGR